MSSRDPRGELLRFTPPRASESLRARVLAGARTAAAGAVRPSRTDRIWYSTAWRLAWVAALSGLIVLETLAMRGAGGHRSATSSSRPAFSESAGAAEAIGLPTRGWIGEQLVTDDETSRGVAEDSL